MVAYSFKSIFVPAIRAGLGFDFGINSPTLRPKRQTIRAVGLRRHARPGETLQLYTGMRTKQCEKIGDARCVGIDHIAIRFPYAGKAAKVVIGRRKVADLEDFAALDGFETWADLQKFWYVNHPDIDEFVGVRIRWEPL